MQRHLNSALIIAMAVFLTATVAASVSAAPVLHTMEPTHGPSGTAVTITGSGFDTATTYSVVLDGVGCPVTGVTADSLSFTVPAGAGSGTVSVIENGGAALLFWIPFTTTRTISGSFSPPAGVSLAGYTVGTQFEAISPDPAGAFQTTVAVDGPTTVAAVREDADPVFMAVVTAADTTVTIDAATTAAAMVFLSPAIGHLEDAAAATVLSALSNLTDVALLADAIAGVSGDGSDYLSDATVLDRIRLAILAAGEALTPPAPASAGALAFQSGSPPNTSFKFNNPDKSDAGGGWSYSSRLEPNTRLRAADADAPGYYNLFVDASDGTKLDWNLALYELSPYQFPMGLAGVDAWGATQVPVRIDDSPMMRTRVGAKLYSRYLDIIDFALGELLEDNGTDIRIPSRTPAVYMARAFSGNLYYGTNFIRNYNDFQAAFIDNLPGGRAEWNIALNANLTVAVLDAVAVIVDAKDFFDDIGKIIYSIQVEVAKSVDMLQRQQASAGRVSPIAFDEIFKATVKTTLKVLYDKASELGIKKVLTGLGKTLLKIIDITGKISSAAQAAERTAGLWGSGTLAVESMIVVVGEPFEPFVTSFSPRRGMRGTIVTIEGYNFDATKDDTGRYNTRVTFGRTGTIVEGEPPELFEEHEADVLYATEHNLIVRVPDAAYTAAIYVQTEKGRTGTYRLNPPYNVFEVVGPVDGVALTVAPEPALSGEVIRIVGSNFPDGGAFDYIMADDAGQAGSTISERGAPYQQVQVIFDGNAASPVTPSHVGPTEILVIGPVGSLATEPHTVAVKVGDSTTTTQTFTVWNPAIETGVQSGSPVIVSTSADGNTADDQMTLREALLLAAGALGRDVTRHYEGEPEGSVWEEDWAGENLGATWRNQITVLESLRGATLNLSSPLPSPGPYDRLDLNGLIVSGAGAVWQVSGVNFTQIQDGAFSGGNAGVVISGGTGNHIWSVDFSNVGGIGIDISGGAAGNKIEFCDFTTVGGHGIYLGGGATGNRLETVTMTGVGGNGVFLDTDAASNRFYHVKTTGTGANGHGLLMSGAAVAYNRFTHDSAFNGDSLNGFSGNGGWGMVIENGAHHNLVHPGQLNDNALGGILIQGTATDYNFIGRESDIVPRTTEVYNNGGPGARLTAGVDHTVLRYLSFAGNAGDGVILDGADCSYNRIQSCAFGVNFITGAGDAGARNQGSGVRLTNGASFNLVGGKMYGSFGWRNAIGNNRDHGILIEGPATAYNVVNQSHIGTVEPIMSMGADISQLPSPYLPNGGSGIVLSGGTHHNIIGDRHQWLDNHIVAHAAGAGILIEGAGTDSNLVAGNQIGVEHMYPGVPPLANRIGIHIRNGPRGNVIGRVGDYLPMNVFPMPPDPSDPSVVLAYFSGNAISNNTVAGIVLENCGADLNADGRPEGANIVVNNEIGVLENGVSAAGNVVGIQLLAGAEGNIIGGHLSGEGNRISHNQAAGIEIDSLQISDPKLANRIANNRFYGNGHSQAAWGGSHLDGYEQGIGVLIRGGSSGQGVGAADAPANTFHSNMVGIYVMGSAGAAVVNNRITGNAFSNSIAGIVVTDSTGCRIGGDGVNARNFVYGTGSAGTLQGALVISGGGGHEVAGNYLGFDGKNTAGNSGWGIVVSESGDNVIGHEKAAHGNTVIGNTLGGCKVTGATAGGNRMVGNFIGVTRSGAAAGNGGAGGIVLDGGASNNLIGGESVSVLRGNRVAMPAPNAIANNTGSGVVVGTGASGNAILYNSISANQLLGISLDGGNADLPSPQILSFDDHLVTGATDLATVPAGSTVQVFADPMGEGLQYLGETRTTAAGTWQVRVANPVWGNLTATATHAAARHTSGFSTFFAVPTGTVNIARTDGGAGTGTFAATTRDGALVLDMTATAGVTDALVTAIRLTASGTADDAQHILDVRLVLDIDGSGTVTAEDIVISSEGAAVFNADDGTLELGIDGGFVPAGQSVRWLLVFDLADTTPLGVTFRVKIAGAADVAAQTLYPNAALTAGGAYPISSDTIETGLTIQDALTLLKMLCGMDVSGETIAPDQTGVAGVGLDDVLFILQKISGLRT